MFFYHGITLNYFIMITYVNYKRTWYIGVLVLDTTHEWFYYVFFKLWVILTYSLNSYENDSCLSYISLSKYLNIFHKSLWVKLVLWVAWDNGCDMGCCVCGSDEFYGLYRLMSWATKFIMYKLMDLSSHTMSIE